MEMKTMHIIRLEEVKKAYGTRVLFEDLSLAVDSGQKTGLIGLNGAGKTTLLRLAAGQEDCDGGTVWRNPKGRIHFCRKNRSSIRRRRYWKAFLTATCRS